MNKYIKMFTQFCSFVGVLPERAWCPRPGSKFTSSPHDPVQSTPKCGSLLEASTIEDLGSLSTISAISGMAEGVSTFKEKKEEFDEEIL